MNKPVTITSFDFENVKRVKAVALSPAQAGLTVIGGRNAQGKTSVLDAICWALGGNDYRPATAARDDSITNPELHLELSNGIVVERKGKNSDLKVIDSEGKKAGQTLLNSFIEKFALDLPKFMQFNDKEKAHVLLRILGIEDQLAAFDKQEQILTQKRLVTGQMERKNRGTAETLPWYADTPDVPLDIADLAEQQREVFEFNNEQQRKADEIASWQNNIIRLENELEDAKAQVVKREADLDYAKTHLETLLKNGPKPFVDTTSITDSIAQAQEINRKVEQNKIRIAAIEESDRLKEEYKALDEQIEQVRNDRMSLLNNVSMPLEGLTVQEGALVYRGHVWSDMSSAEQLKVATAIVRNLNPQCGFVLVDKLEQMDTQTLAEFGQWCESEGLQVIGTRVSTGDECSIIIEDGMVAQTYAMAPEASTETYPSAQALQPALPYPETKQTLQLATGENYAVPAPEDYAQMYGNIQQDNPGFTRRF